MISLKKTARISGLLYLIMAITGAYGIMYVPSQIVVANDPAVTANNLLDNEFLFRTGILSSLICQTVFVFLALSLFKLFEQANKQMARTLLVLVIVSVPIAFLIIFNQFYALLILKENCTASVEPSDVNAFVMTFFKMYDYGNSVISIFWGLWLIPFGKLGCQSGFMPKIIGLLLVLGGVSYIIDAVTFILFPDVRVYSNLLVSILASLAELSTVFWLLIVGVKSPKKVETV